MANFLVGIMTLTIGVVVLASVFMTTVKEAFPDAATKCLASGWNGTHCTGMSLSAAEFALWGLLGIAAIAGIVYGVLNIFGLA